jgi:tetratricopeptide (TPR) repeat protein
MRAALAFALFSAPLPAAEIDVQLKSVDGEVVCSVHTRGANPADVLAEIARKSGRELRGLDSTAPAEAIPVWLDERPLAYVVQTVAACAGWHAAVNISRIELEPDVGRGDPPESFEKQCFLAYLRATRAHPDHPLAAEGEQALGEMREKSGDLRAAKSHYQLVATKFPQSKEAPDALLRSGLIEQRLGDWNAAAAQFSALANLPQAHPYQARARLEIAHCMSQNGDGRQALFVLQALDRLFPTTLTSERQSRLYVRARALLSSKQETDAVQALSAADELGRNEEWDADAMELRAETLGRFGRHAEASRGWLAFAQKSEGPERLRAWVQAAQESREAGDALGVLCVLHLSRGTRAESTIEAIAEEARKEIGLSAGSDPALGGDLLAQARALVDQQKTAKALALLEPLYQRREERPADARLELVVLYAQALAGEKGIDAGVAELRRNLDAFAGPAERKRLCSAAGELYETAERFDEAIRAYGGQL